MSLDKIARQLREEFDEQVPALNASLASKMGEIVDGMVNRTVPLATNASEVEVGTTTAIPSSCDCSSQKDTIFAWMAEKVYNTTTTSLEDNSSGSDLLEFPDWGWLSATHMIAIAMAAVVIVGICCCGLVLVCCKCRCRKGDLVLQWRTNRPVEVAIPMSQRSDSRSEPAPPRDMPALEMGRQEDSETAYYSTLSTIRGRDRLERSSSVSAGVQAGPGLQQQRIAAQVHPLQVVDRVQPNGASEAIEPAPAAQPEVVERAAAEDAPMVGPQPEHEQLD